MNRSPQLVMIHGLLGSLDFFSPATRLAGVTVSTPDLIGYGTNRDSADVQGLRLEDQARWVAESIRAHGKEPVWLLGHSVGGAVAMLLAYDHPQLVAGVISVEGNFTLQDELTHQRSYPCQVLASRVMSLEAEQKGRLRRSPPYVFAR